MQGIVFGADSRRPWLAARSVRSLRHAGLANVKVFLFGDALEFSEGPALLLRAGAWLRETAPLKTPPPSAGGRSVLALGIPHSGKDAAAWQNARQQCGGRTG